MIGTKQQSEEMGTSWITEVMEEMRFALQCYGSSKVIIDFPFSTLKKLKIMIFLFYYSAIFK